MKALREILIAVVLAVVLLFAIGLIYPVEPEIRTIESKITITDIDTLYIQQSPIYIEKKVFLVDTVYVSETGEETETESASLDTTFTDSARLEVTYFITPRVYEVNYRPARVQERTIREVETVYIDSSVHLWWDTYRWGATSGVVATALLTFLVK